MHAEEFVVWYVTPILGVIQTSKIQKLLQHIVGAIKLHESLQIADLPRNQGQSMVRRCNLQRIHRGGARGARG